jgi:hypothetical protein
MAPQAKRQPTFTHAAVRTLKINVNVHNCSNKTSSSSSSRNYNKNSNVYNKYATASSKRKLIERANCTSLHDRHKHCLHNSTLLTYRITTGPQFHTLHHASKQIYYYMSRTDLCHRNATVCRLGALSSCHQGHQTLRCTVSKAAAATHKLWWRLHIRR